MYKCNISQIGKLFFKFVNEMAGNNLSITRLLGLYVWAQEKGLLE